MYSAGFQNTAGKRLKDRGREAHGEGGRGCWSPRVPEPAPRDGQECGTASAGMASKRRPDAEGLKTIRGLE